MGDLVGLAKVVGIRRRTHPPPRRVPTLQGDLMNVLLKSLIASVAALFGFGRDRSRNDTR
jgi:hypothetical protein